MKFQLLSIFACLLLSISGYAQGVQKKEQASKLIPSINEESIANTITHQDLRKHLTIIAADDMEGRETGTAGNKKAAQYIADYFASLGLPAIGNNNSYFQKVAFSRTRWQDIGLYVNDQRYRHLRDFMSFPTRNGDMPLLETDEIVFLGYGIEDSRYSDYKRAKVKGKVILIYKGEPLDKNGNSRLTGTTELSEWSTEWYKKLETAKQHGVKAVLIIENELQKQLSENRRFLLGPRITMGEIEDPSERFANSCYISTNVAKELIGESFDKVVKAREKIKKKGKSRRVKIKTRLKQIQAKNQNTVKGDNVLGYIEGSDPKLKEELVVITAHYDHLGKKGKEIFNGADDNGSGTSTVMEIAEAFQQAKLNGNGAKRSVLVMLVTGEEKGLLGSEYYTENPIFPLENTIANVNVDMVGRVDKKYEGKPDYIYVIGSNRLSTELHDINEAANKKHTQLTLDYTYNAKDDPNRYYYRSDHYNFAEKGIPAIFYFNGTHSDYHRTTDTIEKINFDKMEKIARLVFHTSWELANRDERIKVDVEQEEE